MALWVGVCAHRPRSSYRPLWACRRTMIMASDSHSYRHRSTHVPATLPVDGCIRTEHLTLYDIPQPVRMHETCARGACFPVVLFSPMVVCGICLAQTGMLAVSISICISHVRCLVSLLTRSRVFRSVTRGLTLALTRSRVFRSVTRGLTLAALGVTLCH